MDGLPLLFPVCQEIDESADRRRTKARRGEYCMDAAGRQTPLRQDVDEAPRGKLICNRKIRQHGKPRALAHSFAHGERGI